MSLKQEKAQNKEKTELPSSTKIDASFRKKIQKYAPFFLFIAIAFFVAFTLPSWLSQAKPSPQATPTQTQKVIPTATEKIIIEPSATPTPSKTALPEITPTKTLTPTATPLSEEILDIDPAGNEIPMRLVPSGEFIMGDPGEGTERTEYLDGFYLDKYEVTNTLYKACVEVGNCLEPKNSDDYNNSSYANHPVVYVDWHQAKAYCEWRNGDLPTEFQWEKAARGVEGQIYPWGETITCDYANYVYDISILSISGVGYTKYCIDDTVSVGSYDIGVSPFNIYELTGNVSEWTKTSFSVSPLLYIVRGGSFSTSTLNIQTFHRFKVTYDTASSNLGFRCAKDAP